MDKLNRQQWIRTLLQFTVGAGVVVLSGWLAFRFWPRQELPNGWQLIRPPLDVMALAEYNNQIWAGGRDGLVRIDPESGEIVEAGQSGVDVEYVTSLLVDVSGDALWVGHSRGLSHLEQGIWTTMDVSTGLPSNRVLALAQDHHGNLWVGTDAGLLHLQEDGQLYTVENGLAGSTVSTIYVDSQGRVWAGGGIFYEEGLSVYDGSSWEILSVKDVLAHPMVNTILESPQGELWVGTGYSSYGGLSHYDGSKWRTIDREDGLAGWKVRLLFQDSLSRIWVSSEYNGIAFSSGDGWQILTPDDGLAGWEVKSMMEDSAGDLWLGTENGLTRIEHDVWIRLSAQ